MNLLVKFVSKIKNNSYTEVVDIQELPKNWKIQKSYFENLILNINKDQEVIDKYIIQKRKTNTQLLFNNIIRNLNIIKPIIDISGEEHVFNCDMSIKRYSKMTTENCGLFLHYIFLITLINLVNVDMLFIGELKDIKLKTKTFDGDDGIGVISLKSNSKSNKSNDDMIGVDVDASVDIEKQKYEAEQNRSNSQIMVSNMIFDLLTIINKNQEFYDKHTSKYMSQIIDKQMDIEKEENLKFIEELDKESRQSIKSMITIGIESWKNLSKKDDKILYFGENINKSIVDEDANLNGITYNEEETEELNRQQMIQEYGEEYTDEQYQAFIGRLEDNSREDNQVQLDMDVMRDDDGDGDFGPEDEEDY